MTQPATLEQVRTLLENRKSVRGFRPDPIPMAQLRALFGAAQRAPSWCNTQPWRVVITNPPVTGQIVEQLVAAATSSKEQPDMPFPEQFPKPYAQHRHACGVALNGAMNIGRGDKEKRHAAWLRNYQLFDAPHLAVVGLDRRLGPYGILDVGVWLGILFTVAASMGIDCCAMGSIAAYPQPLREALLIPEEELLLFGLALGYEDSAAPANACRTTRDPLEANIRFVGFDPASPL